MRPFARLVLLTCSFFLASIIVLNVSIDSEIVVRYSATITAFSHNYSWKHSFRDWLQGAGGADEGNEGEGNHSHSIPLRNLSDYKRGRWVLNSSITTVPYTSNGVLHLCMAAHMKTEAWLQNKTLPTALQYQWVPDDPSAALIPWSRDTFCRALNGRNILIVGDSISDHWHDSLLRLLGVTKMHVEGSHYPKRFCRGHWICYDHFREQFQKQQQQQQQEAASVDQAPGSNDESADGAETDDPEEKLTPLSAGTNSKATIRRLPPKLRFVTNQLLANRSFWRKKGNRNQDWWKFLNGSEVLILNAGSWMVDPAKKSTAISEERYADMMRTAARMVQDYKGQIIWRTTPHGHPNCTAYESPLLDSLATEQLNVSTYKKYRWWALEERNRISTAIWREAGAKILDVAPLTNRMPLWHLGVHHPEYQTKNITDCLHYCAPGPVYDTWSTLLMNLLLGQIDG